MDKDWDVVTAPHHFHPRFVDEGSRSPMNGEANHDIQLLITLIKKGSLKNQAHRF